MIFKRLQRCFRAGILRFDCASTDIDVNNLRFGEKAKVLASRIGKAIQIGALKLRQRRILRELGAKIRQSGVNSSLKEETRSACAVAERIGSLDAELKELAP